MSDQKRMELFLELFGGLSQQAPGSFESTGRAWELLPALSERPRILDLGCGSGRQTLDLARLSGGQITAVDLHQTFLERLDARARKEGLDGRVRTMIGDMGELDLPAGSFDLIWSEGAIYNVGWEAGLKHWRALLADPGWVVVTECCWLTSDPSPDCSAFWAEEYPTMMTMEECSFVAQEAGYTVLHSFKLPDSDWLENFHVPLEANLAAFRKKHGSSREALAVARMCESELSIHRRFANEYGYVCFVLQAVSSERT